MTDLHDNNDKLDPSDYWKEVIANLDGSYEMYLKMRDVLTDDDYEKWFERASGFDNMTQYLETFAYVHEYLDYLHEMAIELEDYRFCEVLKTRRLWAHWKLTEIERNMVDTTELDMFLDDIDI